jgi:hypothetical protein
MVCWVSLLRVFPFLGVVVGLLSCLATTPARADQEPILLEYSADPGCPSGAEFERMVFERAHKARPALAQEPARLFAVTIRDTKHGVQGSLTVSEGGVNLVRQVQGKNCRQLASVLALAAALAIDPAAELSASPEAEDTEPEELAATPKGESARQGTEVGSDQTPSTGRTLNPQRTEAKLESSPANDKTYREAAERSTPSILYGEFSLGPRLELGATPYPAFGPFVTLGILSPNGRWRAQLGGSWLFTPSKQVGGADAEFRVLTGTLSVCALALQWRNNITGGPCLHAEWGDVFGRGSNIDYESRVHRMWSTAGAHVHVRIPRNDVWFLAANIGANVLLNRYTFEFDEPETEVFSQSPVTGTINIVVGALF